MPEMAQLACSTTDQPEALRSWPVAIDQGGGTKKHRLVKLLYRSHLMPDLESVPESATAKALASKPAPLPPRSPFFCKKKTKDLTEQLFGQEDVKSD